MPYATLGGMDAVDRQIIAALRANGRATYAELGRQVGLSASAVHERVGKLESSGVITGYHAVVDPPSVGLGVTALVGIQPTDTGDDDEIAAALAELPEVESCYAVAGDEAFVVKIRVATVDELERSLGRLRRIDGIARTRTTVVLSTRFEGRPNAPEPAPPPTVPDKSGA
ncbi:Lrp/AsnC family transcriptional regulator, leucine-responsive regulatory protein [Streptoalloteichus tenebrarius]|uniref:Lrp/AsnC family transcriptional regulator, leucine-responsive regulatory protein n=2 Tax=Streptoalloteichus tenebrarius (strain ATCC 17920 / DSM 40477 / JCM 4838 / CBS 697.72 / NBRC 16177 / NCIMB 11028 / NRRL B-12390 / A12253. 1 / ISP 5477) TaxID=1933 RepID=A0ABT1I4D6_STRSD|nr:Lrp/AsnC family transcriptional regulator, leucine-responsive regulatory protein [Streptoalloteichus tenebrarius]BFF02456.1 Lrp/AsnC family transcriptional regulator [Streptoalloteichus tenebrarius]